MITVVYIILNIIISIEPADITDYELPFQNEASNYIDYHFRPTYHYDQQKLSPTDFFNQCYNVKFVALPNPSSTMDYDEYKKDFQFRANNVNLKELKEKLDKAILNSEMSRRYIYDSPEHNWKTDDQYYEKNIYSAQYNSVEKHSIHWEPLTKEDYYHISTLYLLFPKTHEIEDIFFKARTQVALLLRMATPILTASVNDHTQYQNLIPYQMLQNGPKYKNSSSSSNSQILDPSLNTSLAQSHSDPAVNPNTSTPNSQQPHSLNSPSRTLSQKQSSYPIVLDEKTQDILILLSSNFILTGEKYEDYLIRLNYLGRIPFTPEALSKFYQISYPSKSGFDKFGKESIFYQLPSKFFEKHSKNEDKHEIIDPTHHHK